MTSAGRQETQIKLGEHAMVLDPSGALWWPQQSLLAVADLHLEKGSAYAAAGSMLPPYDTKVTLGRIEALVAHYQPKRLLCLGDSFHDRTAGERIETGDFGRLNRIAADREWIWITGNHDPELPPAIVGRVAEEMVLNGIVFRHEATPDQSGESNAEPEVSGHFHPKAKVRSKLRTMSRPCFIEDGRRLILPAFGALTGGLDVTDPAIANLFSGGFTAHVLGRGRLFRIPSASRALQENRRRKAEAPKSG
jgi:DNA ligase-associated metallophosphoesterase